MSIIMRLLVSYLWIIKFMYFPVLSLIVNLTLIALIIKCSRKEMGAYRYLLLTFAAVDIYYGIVHFLVMPVRILLQIIPKWTFLDPRIMGKRVLYGRSWLRYWYVFFFFDQRFARSMELKKGDIFRKGGSKLVRCSTFTLIYRAGLPFSLSPACCQRVGGYFVFQFFMSWEYRQVILHSVLLEAVVLWSTISICSCRRCCMVRSLLHGLSWEKNHIKKGDFRFCIIHYLYDADQFVVEYIEPILNEHTIVARLPIDQYTTAVFWVSPYLFHFCVCSPRNCASIMCGTIFSPRNAITSRRTERSPALDGSRSPDVSWCQQRCAVPTGTCCLQRTRYGDSVQ